MILAFLFLVPATAILGGAATKRRWFLQRESLLWGVFVGCCAVSLVCTLYTAITS